MSELLPCVTVEPSDPPEGVVLWLHGLGASGHDFEPIVPALDLPGVRFVFPHAPQRAVTINQGMVMPSWYDIRTIARGPDREDSGQIEDSAERIRALLEREIEQGTSPDRIVLAGFSQGAAMSLYVGQRFAESLRGLLVLSGYLLREDSTEAEAHAANQATPIFFGHGTRDPVVPVAAGRRACEWLGSRSRDTTWRDYPIGHEVSMDEVRDIASWLHERFPGT